MRCKGIDGAVGIRLAQRVGVGIWRVSVRRTLASLAHLANCGAAVVRRGLRRALAFAAETSCLSILERLLTEVHEVLVNAMHLGVGWCWAWRAVHCRT